MPEQVASLRYTLRDDTIHEFVIYQADVLMIYQGMGRMAQLFRSTPLDETIRLLVIHEQTRIVPIIPLNRAVGGLLRSFPERALTRSAHIVNDAVNMAILKMLVGMFAYRSERFRVFARDHEDEAVAWLLDNQ